jgi:uridine kinase
VQHRVLVGIDGPDSAGKTTLADRLADHLTARDVPTLRASVDGFHSPRHLRQRGELSPEGYYLDAFDYPSLVDHLLMPFTTGATSVRTATYDHRAEAAVEVIQSDLPTQAVLVLDGVFLLRAQLRDHWTLVVYLHVSAEETLRRALVRDVHHMGSASAVRRRYEARYLPGQALYRQADDPMSRADITIDNTDPAAPQVLRWDPVNGR